jgi:hypothetical protein
MTGISSAHSIVVSVWRIVIHALMTSMFPTWYGSARLYHPEEHYMRGPGPKWRTKNLMGRNG